MASADKMDPEVTPRDHCDVVFVLIVFTVVLM
jgi:hypothetical protein